jgi:hypothetical protein
MWLDVAAELVGDLAHERDLVTVRAKIKSA